MGWLVVGPLTATVGGGRAERVTSIAGRFATPAYNGDLLRTEIWVGDDAVLFRVRNQRGDVVIDRGRATCS